VESKVHVVPYGARLKVDVGDVVEAGDELTEGSVDPKDLLRIKGARGVQNYILREVQKVYRLQGVEINDKHVEVMVRQMMRKVRITDAGTTDLLPGSIVDIHDYEDANRKCCCRAGIRQWAVRFCSESPRLHWRPIPSCRQHRSKKQPAS
jgi:DNA-directed RNA polymerase subunit beta'